MPPIKILSIAAGSRGSGYATYAEKHPDRVQIVGVAEPRDFYRQQMVGNYDIPMANTFTDWREAVKREKFADAVIIATQDAMHTEPAIAFAEKGYQSQHINASIRRLTRSRPSAPRVGHRVSEQ